jgi:hypothetical protein
MKRALLNRRSCLRGAAAALAAYPFVAGIASQRAAAQAGVFPRRFVCIYTPNGHHRDHWPVSGPETGYALPTELAALEPFRDQILVLRNCEGSYGHHAGHSEALTGQPQEGFESFLPKGGPSLDQVFAKASANDVPVPSLELGVETGTNASGIISYLHTGLPVPAVNDALAGFERAFGDVLAGADPAEAARRRQLGLSIVDKLARDFDDVTRHLDKDERALLDSHLGLVRDHEERLKNPPPEKQCEPTQTGGGLDFPSTTRAHLDTIVQALACDVTRTATLAIGPSGSTTHYSWAGANVDFHEAAHGAISDSLTMLSRINSWHAGEVAYLLERLAAVPEGDGTLLDNTLVLWTNELGVHTFDHARTQAPVLLAGRAGGTLRTGRLVDVDGAHYHDVLLTLAHAMGHTSVSQFGDRGSRVLGQLLV